MAVSPERLEEIAALCAGANVKTPLRVVEGGGSRAQSVLLAALAAGDSCELLAVHDGARPLIPAGAGGRHGAAGTADLCRRAGAAGDGHGEGGGYGGAGAVHTGPENAVRRADAQVFQANILKAALQSAIQAGADITDDCSAVERLGKEVWLAPGWGRTSRSPRGRT